VGAIRRKDFLTYANQANKDDDRAWRGIVCCLFYFSLSIYPLCDELARRATNEGYSFFILYQQFFFYFLEYWIRVHGDGGIGLLRQDKTMASYGLINGFVILFSL